MGKITSCCVISGFDLSPKKKVSLVHRKQTKEGMAMATLQGRCPARGRYGDHRFTHAQRPRPASSEKTRLRIQTAMEELDYHPNELARSLAKKTAILSASSFPRRTTFFFSCVIASVERYASAGGYKLLLCVSNHEIQKREGIPSACFWGNKVAGIILASHTPEPGGEFADGTHPVITIDRTVRPPASLPPARTTTTGAISPLST